MHARAAHPVRWGRVQNPDLVSGQSAPQPTGQHGRSHLATAQKHDALRCDPCVLHVIPPTDQGVRLRPAIGLCNGDLHRIFRAAIPPHQQLQRRVIALRAHHRRPDHGVDLLGAGHLPAGQDQTIAIDHQLLLFPIGKGTSPALIIHMIQKLIKSGQLLFRRLHLKGANHTQCFIITGPCQRDGIGPPLALNGHCNLIIGDTIEIPLMMFGQVFDNIDGMNVFFQELLGKCHGATSYSLVAKGAGSAPSARCLL
mmetsp:Transcript_23469/g.41256  ORF Transcript_23469/g.41256 Transcript_23469/m.41256 type:complete len:254 (-) Transcript_23469:533-1294(-)